MPKTQSTKEIREAMPNKLTGGIKKLKNNYVVKRLNLYAT